MTSTPSDPWSLPAADPVPMPDPIAPGPVIVQVGEIGVTSTVVHTPAGDIPLRGSTWQVSDYWHSEQRIPKWAIVAAIGRLLRAHRLQPAVPAGQGDDRTGTVQVTVTNGTQQYVARIPVTDQAGVTTSTSRSITSAPWPRSSSVHGRPDAP